MIIGMTTCVYIVSQLPYLYLCFEFYNVTDTLHGLTKVKYARFAFIIIQTSCFVNPLIYFTTNKRYRQFAINFIAQWLGLRDWGRKSSASSFVAADAVSVGNYQTSRRSVNDIPGRRYTSYSAGSVLMNDASKRRSTYAVGQVARPSRSG